MKGYNMNVYNVELLDKDEHEIFLYAQLAPNIVQAIEIAKSDAINVQDKNKVNISYIHVSDDNEHYMYNIVTKTLYYLI